MGDPGSHGIALAAAAPALAKPPENSIRGLITEVSRSAEVVLVEEDPSDESGLAKGQFAVTGETEILEQQGENLAPVSFEDLRVGQMVEATYAGPSPSCTPRRGSPAGSSSRMETGSPAVLPDTGGALLPVLGALLIAGGLLAYHSLR